MSWYIVKKKTETRWTAYDVTEAEVKSIKRGYEYKGPYKSLIAAMAAANGDERVAGTIESPATKTQPVCAECDCPIRPGDKEFQRDDGAPLCWECYGRLYGPRDKEDAPWRAGDFLFDWSRDR